MGSPFSWVIRSAAGCSRGWEREENSLLGPEVLILNVWLIRQVRTDFSIKFRRKIFYSARGRIRV